MVAPDDFRRVLSHFATGVTIVTTRDTDGRPTGLTVSAFCSVSLDPPQILVCVDHKSQSYPALRDRAHFAVNFLGDAHEGVSRHVEGDHTILVALVEEARNGAGEPLLYYRGKYRRLSELPSGATS